MELFLPPDLAIANAAIALDANTAAFSSPTVGTTRTVERLGDRYHMQFDLTTVNDSVGLNHARGRIQALLSRLRGQANRIWLTPPGATLRGSFPATEQMTNSTFANGTTGWSTGTMFNATVTDRVYRATRNAQGAGAAIYQAPVYTRYAPYVARAYAVASPRSTDIPEVYFNNEGVAAQPADGKGGYMTASAPLVVAGSQGDNIAVYVLADSNGRTGQAGDYIDVHWMSVSRCAQVDNSPNLLQYSDQPGQSPWTLGGLTSSVYGAAPDNTGTCSLLVETNSSNIQHNAQQSVAVPAGAGQDDYTLTAFLYAGRAMAILQMVESTGSQSAAAWFNISAGTIGSTNLGGSNWSNIRTSISPAGYGWYKCSITATKASLATSVLAVISSATTDGVFTYAGSNGTAAMNLWRAGLSKSSFPFLPSLTTSASIGAGVAQNGTGYNLKALPVSTSGLLLRGDWIEWKGQLNQVAAQLDSDASGLGYLQCVRPFRNAPADNDAIVVNNPMGKFMLSPNSSGALNGSLSSWADSPGLFTDASIELIEDIAF